MKRKKTPRSSQLLFEPLESRLLLDATNVAADDGPMPQTSASETGPAVEVSAEATPTAGGSMAPSGIAGREPAGDATFDHARVHPIEPAVAGRVGRASPVASPPVMRRP